MSFLAPEFLYLLFAAPVAAALLALALWSRRRAAARFYGQGAGRPWAPAPSLVRGVLSTLCWTIALAAVAVALARPAHSPQPRKVERSGRDVVFVLDVSRSMLAQDLRPSRLERAKLMVSDVLDAIQGDRVGLVAFAGTPVVRCPLTTDYSFARMSIESISTDSVGRGGTAIGDAVRAALAILQAGQAEGQLAADIYLLTDGEDHETRPIEAAHEAAKLGVRLVTIGLGSDAGAPVPADPEQSYARAQSGFMQYEGQRVQSRMDAQTLRAMAEATPGGAFLNVGTGNLELDRVYRLLQRDGQRKQIESTETMRYTEVFQLPLALAVLCGVLAMLIDGTYFKRRGVRAARLVPAAVALALLLPALPARAQSLADDLNEGARLLEAGKPGEALSLYEGAAVRHPDAAAIALGRGCAHLQLQQTSEAASSFRNAEQLATDPAIAARARYNLGLLDAQEAVETVKKDPKAALETLARAERWFRNALPGLTGADRDAAGKHVETVQAAREALRKQIAEQEAQQQNQQPQQQQSQSQSQSGGSGEGQGQSQPQQQPQGDQQQDQQQKSPERTSAEDLANLAQQQEHAANQSQKLGKQQDQTAEQKQQQAQQLADEQRKLSEQAEKLDKQLQQQQAEARAREEQQQQQGGQGQQPRDSENIERSRERLDEARRAQARAEEQLRQGDTSGAEQAQREAAEKLKDAARAALGIDQQPEQSEPGEQAQQPNDQQAQQPQRAFDATAANILDREARQREAIRRFLKSQQRTRTPPVEKDW